MKILKNNVFFKILCFTLAIILILLTAVVILYVLIVPWDCDTMTFWLKCINFSDEGNPMDNIFGRLNGVYTLEDNYRFQKISGMAFLWYVAAWLKTIKYKPTNDIVTDAEVFRIDFQNDYIKIKSYTFAYDFYQKKVYAFNNGTWHEVKNAEKLDKLISYIFSICINTSIDDTWRGQSTYISEEFFYEIEEFNFEKPTFRYNLRWSLSERIRDSHMYQFRDTDFKNTESRLIANADEAIKRASEEFGYDKYCGFAYYDETCGYWLVEIYEDKGLKKELTNEYLDIVHDSCKTVIMNEEGVTVEIYKSLTTYYQFFYE